LRIPHTFYN